MTIVIAAPDVSRAQRLRGRRITGIDAAESNGALVFQGGTAIGGGRLVTNGGRILSVTAVAATRALAREQAYAAAAKIGFEGAWYRTDVAS